jgi:hypothetical protein
MAGGDAGKHWSRRRPDADIGICTSRKIQTSVALIKQGGVVAG